MLQLSRLLGNQQAVDVARFGDDRTAIAKVSALGTELGTTAETRNDVSKTTCEIDDKN